MSITHTTVDVESGFAKNVILDQVNEYPVRRYVAVVETCLFTTQLVNIIGFGIKGFAFSELFYHILEERHILAALIRHNLQHAAQQSPNIIIDLRRCKMDEAESIRQLKQHFELSKRLRIMKILTKDELVIDFEK